MYGAKTAAEHRKRKNEAGTGEDEASRGDRKDETIKNRSTPENLNVIICHFYSSAIFSLKFSLIPL